MKELIDLLDDETVELIAYSKDIPIPLLNQILGFEHEKKITEVEFLEPLRDPEILRNKRTLFDVLCKDQQGSQSIVEMQVADPLESEKTVQFFAARSYTGQINRPGNDQGLKQMIFLIISDFIIFEGKPECFSTHAIVDAKALTRDLKDLYFCFLELPKFNKSIDQLENFVDKWAYFFKHASYTTPEELDQMTHGDPVFKEACQALIPCYCTDKELFAYEQQEKYILDELNWLYTTGELKPNRT